MPRYNIISKSYMRTRRGGRYAIKRKRVGVRRHPSRAYIKRGFSRLGISLNTHSFKRRVQLFGQAGAISNSCIVTNVGNGGGYASTAFNFIFNQMHNYSEFAALFDEYRIDYVKIIVQCLTVSNNTYELYGAPYGIGLPKMYYYHDTDDVSAPSASVTGLKEMQEVVKCKMFTFAPNRTTCTFKIKPNLLTMNYMTVASTAYTPAYDRWVDMADTNAPYYGLKMLFQVPSVNAVLPDNAKHAFQVDAVYYFTCKDVR